MKILYNQIKEYVPDLKASPKEVGEALTLTGFMMESFEEIKHKGQTDYLIGLEIRQNRADCLSVIGIVREVAAYYGIQAKIPDLGDIASSNEKLDIDVNKSAVDFVKRIWAVKFCELENRESPEWLKEYLFFYDINSINLLVDLSNYVMLVTGYPSHLIDVDKITEPISWSLNKNFKKTTTLDGTEVQLSQKNELIVEDKRDVIALAGIVGTKYSPVDINSKSIILEMAVYDRTIIRRDSRNLRIVTEASHRLEKDLDSNGVDYAARMLSSLILKYCNGKIASEVFDYYPKKRISQEIKFDGALPSVYAGVEIKKDEVTKILKNLRFKVDGKGDKVLVTPPIDRMDISMEQDLVEEVVRIYGYDKIPSDDIPELRVVKDITPKNIILCERIRDILITLGYDEVLSWLLTRSGANKLVNYLEWDVVSTQNSVNELYPDLRQSIATSLINQFKEYEKKNVQFINIFEIGKIFGHKDGKYIEYESLGILSCSETKGLSLFKENIEKLLRLVGLKDIKYKVAKVNPNIANPNSCWDLELSGKSVGVVYKLRPQQSDKNLYFTELNITKTADILNKTQNNPVVELTQKLIVLDCNVEIKKEESINDYLDKIKSKIKADNVWSIVIADKYPLKDKIRYTIRVTYKELSDQEAKSIHAEAFKEFL